MLNKGLSELSWKTVSPLKRGQESSIALRPLARWTFTPANEKGSSWSVRRQQWHVSPKKFPNMQGCSSKMPIKRSSDGLKKRAKSSTTAPCHHRYPFCWRSDTPLIYKAVTTWFVAVEKIKDSSGRSQQADPLDAGAHQIWPFWQMAGKCARLGDQPQSLLGNSDPDLASRGWGDCIVIGSIAELEKLTGAKIDDLHRHFIDRSDLYQRMARSSRAFLKSLTAGLNRVRCPMRKITILLKIKNYLQKSFPADFIAEGLDQTRGWFYTLTMLVDSSFQQACV